MKNIAGKWNIEGFPGAVWEFIEFRRNEKISKSMLIEQCVGQPADFTIYLFDCQKNILTVDRSDSCDDNFVFACYEEYFRIERTGGDTLRLASWQQE